MPAALLQYMSPLLAQRGHTSRIARCPLSGVKRTSVSDCSRWSLTPIFQILALSEGAPNSEERPSSCPPVELATWPSDDHCSRLVFITKNIREAQVRRLFDAARMLTADATGPKRCSSPLRLQSQAARIAYAPHTWGASYAQQHAIAREESPCMTRAKLLAVAHCKWPARSPAWRRAAHAARGRKRSRRCSNASSGLRRSSTRSSYSTSHRPMAIGATRTTICHRESAWR